MLFIIHNIPLHIMVIDRYNSINVPILCYLMLIALEGAMNYNYILLISLIY